MSSSEIAVSARGLGKSYIISHKVRETTFAEAALRFLSNPRGMDQKQEIWPLRDISFDIKRGEIVGIIGRNGAGKSTLLKILSRIVEPTTGEARIRGRVGSLIEVGTGFQPELTGRENIYLNGAILGMRRAEIDRRFDEIVEFSGVEQFLDTPVKRYSSGMYVRLAFAVAAHLDTDILIVDEVLAVGDAEFQKKCLGRLGEVAHDGRTVLFVSHNAAALEALCNRGIYFEKGRVVSQGALVDVLDDYHRHARADLETAEADGGLKARLSEKYQYFRDIDIVDHRGCSSRVAPMGAPLNLRFAVEAKSPIEYPTFEVLFRNALGQNMMTLRSPNNEAAIKRIEGVSEICCTIDRLPFAPGDYSVSIKLMKAGTSLETADSELTFMVRNADAFGDGWGAVGNSFCVAPSTWKVSGESQRTPAMRVASA
jgi:lipopolysaccharide transport system ATP-binding protein